MKKLAFALIVIAAFFCTNCATITPSKNISISTFNVQREYKVLGTVKVEKSSLIIPTSLDDLNELLRQEAYKRYKDADAVINVKYATKTIADGILNWEIAKAAEGTAIKFIEEEKKDKTTNKPEQFLDASKPNISSRQFFMGFTTFPPDFTQESISNMYNFIKTHSDLITHHFDNGIPWVEAFNGEGFSAHLRDNWKSQKENTAEGHKIYVAITPLDSSRKNIAAYWGKSDNMPLPAPWDKYALNSDETKRAFLNYAKRVIEYFNPDYFAIGIEVNLLFKEDRVKWQQYKELHKYIYAELKKEYPNLPIFASISIDPLKGLGGENAAIQQKEMQEFMNYNDILGLSAYPYGWNHWPIGKLDPIPEDFFDIALSFKKAIAITETGAPSKDFSAFGINYRFDEDYQKRYIELLLRKASDYNFVFIVNWAAIDFDKLLEKFPPQTKEIGSIWAYTGLQNNDGVLKKVVSVWDTYLKLPKKSTN